MKFIKFYLAVFTLALSLNFISTEATAQCAMCRTSVETANDGKLVKFGSGLNKGILYLMAIPYVLAGTVGFFWYRHNRKQ
ncbi:hypothetical protein [Adhaeribacter aquaticus]|uniref:hypothetical protein n=1 Tax=Adhaeribacter aquaticus TaxID=299567 RepID=UPI0004795547|nr:hypothetical protein [Adhaeribacter aquaticus]